MVLWLSGFDESLAIKYVSINKKKRMVRPILIDMKPDELCYYPFIISMDRCERDCSTAEDPFGTICVSNKIEDISLKVFNKIKKRNESNKLSKDISCEFRCGFDGRKCNSKQKRNNDNCQRECTKPIQYQACDEGYAWNPRVGQRL